MTGNKSRRRPRLSVQIGLAKLASAIIIGAGWLVLVGAPSSLAQTNYYVNSLWGSNSFDGLQPLPIGGGSGPKQQVSAAIATATSGDTIEIAQGMYQDAVWSPGSKNLILRPMGTVTLVDYDPRLADSDNDGMTNAWEAYYGFDPYAVQTGNYAPGADPDEDGLTNLQESQLGTNPWVPNLTVADPIIDTGGATNIGVAQVSISTTTPGASIRYTTDGSEPTTNSDLYVEPFWLSATWNGPQLQNYTVKARAFKTGHNSSSVASTNVSLVELPPIGYMENDPSTRGNWKQLYGTEGYHVVGDTNSYPEYVTVTPVGVTNLLWTATPNDSRALWKATTTNDQRIAARWMAIADNTFQMELNFTEFMPTANASLYFLDWEGAGRSVQVDIKEYYTGFVLDSRTVSGFTNGVYVTWALGGRLLVQVTGVGSSNPEAVLSGLFFEPVGWNPGVDSDSDGIPDVWASVHGLDPNDPTAADAIDPESDGLTYRWVFRLRDVEAPPPPAIWGSILPAPNVVGWNTNSTVTVHFEATGSNVVHTADVTIQGETNDCMVAGVATDAFGRVAYDAAVVYIDQTPPVLTVDPTNNVPVDRSHPLFIVEYGDVISGLNLDSLQITLGGVDVTTNFYRFDGGAIASVTNLPADTYTWTAEIGDWAGNTTAQTNTFRATGTTNSYAPTLANFNIAAFVEAPDMDKIWIQGLVSDTSVVVWAMANMGDPRPFAVRAHDTGGFVPLQWGTNVIAVVAADATTNNFTSALFVVVRTDRYRVAITQPGIDVFANGQDTTYTGYVSAWLDEGLETASPVVGLSINGQAVSLSDADANGNRGWTATIPASANGNGFTSIDAVITFANGQTRAVPCGAKEEGYEVIYWRQDTTSVGGLFYPCPLTYTCNPTNSLHCCLDPFSNYLPNWDQVLGETLEWYNCNAPTNEQWMVQTKPFNPTNSLCVPSLDPESWGALGDWSSPTNNTSELGKIWGLKLGFSKCEDEQLEYYALGGGSPDFGCLQTYGATVRTQSWDGQLSIAVPGSYDPQTPVTLTFAGVTYAFSNSLSWLGFNVNGVVYWPSSWTSDSVSYELNLTGGAVIPICRDSFVMPPPATRSQTNQIGAIVTILTTSEQWFSFTGFENQVVRDCDCRNHPRVAPRTSVTLCNDGKCPPWAHWPPCPADRTACGDAIWFSCDGSVHYNLRTASYTGEVGHCPLTWESTLINHRYWTSSDKDVIMRTWFEVTDEQKHLRKIQQWWCNRTEPTMDCYTQDGNGAWHWRPCAHDEQ